WAEEQREFVHPLQIIAGVAKAGQQVQRSTTVASLLQEFAPSAILERLVWLAMAPGEHPLSCCVQPRLVVAQLKQGSAVAPQKDDAPNDSERTEGSWPV